MEREIVSYISSDGHTAIDARLWLPSHQEPKAIVQIVHGMAEHVDRYEPFAHYLTDQGYAVCAENHLGHGGSVDNQDDLGYIPAQGKEILIADVHQLRKAMQSVYTDIPYVVFGHSMGSFITRAYIACHGEGLAAAVLCGTGNQPLLISKVGRMLALALTAVKGSHYRSAFLDHMGVGAFSDKLENPRTPVDWLSTDPLVVDAYLADEECGQMFTVSAYATLLDLTGEVVTLDCARRVPEKLPLLFIAGAGDPVGDFGKGVLKAANLAEKAGSEDVTVILYEGMRHEILNEPDNARVYDDVSTWLEERL